MLSWNPITNSRHGHRRAINFSKTIMDAKVVSPADIFAVKLKRAPHSEPYSFCHSHFCPTISLSQKQIKLGPGSRCGSVYPKNMAQPPIGELKVVPWIVASSSHAQPNWDRIAYSDLSAIVNIDRVPLWLLRKPVYLVIYLVLLALSATRPEAAITPLLIFSGE